MVYWKERIQLTVLSLRTLGIKPDVRRLFVYRKIFADIINMTYSCCVESGMICMEGCYEKNIVGVGIVDTSM